MSRRTQPANNTAFFGTSCQCNFQGSDGPPSVNTQSGGAPTYGVKVAFCGMPLLGFTEYTPTDPNNPIRYATQTITDTISVKGTFFLNFVALPTQSASGSYSTIQTYPDLTHFNVVGNTLRTLALTTVLAQTNRDVAGCPSDQTGATLAQVNLSSNEKDFSIPKDTVCCGIYNFEGYDPTPPFVPPFGRPINDPWVTAQNGGPLLATANHLQKQILSSPVAPADLDAAAQSLLSLIDLTNDNELYSVFDEPSVLLQWTPVNSVTGYTILRASNIAGPFTSIGTVGPTFSTFTDTGVVNGNSYYYKVQSGSSGPISTGAGVVVDIPQNPISNVPLVLPPAPPQTKLSAGSAPGNFSATFYCPQFACVYSTIATQIIPTPVGIFPINRAPGFVISRKLVETANPQFLACKRTSGVTSMTLNTDFTHGYMYGKSRGFLPGQISNGVLQLARSGLFKDAPAFPGGPTQDVTANYHLQFTNGQNFGFGFLLTDELAFDFTNLTANGLGELWYLPI